MTDPTPTQASAIDTALSAIEKAAQVITPIATAANATAGIVVGAVGAGAGLALDLLRAGHDPVAAITRIRDALPFLNTTEDEWSQRLGRKAVGP